jgi:hypothetical protein
MNRIAISGLFLICIVATTVVAQQTTMKPRTESKETKIARTISAAPLKHRKSS